MNNISIRKMRIFLAAIEERSFTKASVKQNISQPAATIVINQIEETIGAELFERQGTSRRAVVTPAGQQVADTFSRIVAGYDGELSALTDVSRGKQTVRQIGIQTGFDESLDADWLLSLMKLFTTDTIAFKLDSRDAILRGIHERDADIGVFDGTLKDEKADYLQAGSYRVCLLVPPTVEIGGDPSNGVTWSDVPANSYLFSSMSPQAVRQTLGSLRAAGTDTGELVQVPSAALISTLMKVDPRPMILPDVVGHKIVEGTDLILRAFSDGTIEVPFGLVTQWGHIARFDTSHLREKTCFIEPIGSDKDPRNS